MPFNHSFSSLVLLLQVLEVSCQCERLEGETVYLARYIRCCFKMAETCVHVVPCGLAGFISKEDHGVWVVKSNSIHSVSTLTGHRLHCHKYRCELKLIAMNWKQFSEITRHALKALALSIVLRISSRWFTQCLLNLCNYSWL